PLLLRRQVDAAHPRLWIKAAQRPAPRHVRLAPAVRQLQPRRVDAPVTLPRDLDRPRRGSDLQAVLHVGEGHGRDVADALDEIAGTKPGPRRRGTGCDAGHAVAVVDVEREA